MLFLVTLSRNMSGILYKSLMAYVDNEDSVQSDQVILPFCMIHKYFIKMMRDAKYLGQIVQN